MKIQVTQEHINKGPHRDACRCPVALAMQSAFNGEFVHVDRKLIKVKESIFHTPVEVRAFVRRYDTFATVHPFEFELPIEEAA
jgi:hypothetical protein